MMKWIENLKKAISGARNNKKNGKKKNKNLNDFHLDSVEETKTLNSQAVITRPKGPRNRRLPNRQQVACEAIKQDEFNEIERSTESHVSTDQPTGHSTTDHQTNVNQFKLNLDELNNHRLRSKDQQNKSTDKLFDASTPPQQLPIVPPKPVSVSDGNQFTANDTYLINQNLNKLKSIVKLRAKSVSDDLLDSKDTKENEDHLNQLDSIQVVNSIETASDLQKKNEENTSKAEQVNNVKQKREQLMQRLRRLETKNKCKSMVSLNDTSTFDVSPTRTVHQSSSNQHQPINNTLNQSSSNRSKVVSLNNLTNLPSNQSSSNLLADIKANLRSTNTTHLTSNNNQATKLVNSNQLVISQQPVNSKVNTLSSNRSNTLNSQSNSNYSTAISRNNSLSSSGSSKSTNSSYLTGFSSSADQSNDGNLNGNAILKTSVEASKLKKKIQNKQNKKALNTTQFYVQLDDENNSKVSTRNNRPVVANRASLNLNNNNNNDEGVDELTKKFIERGLSTSLKVLNTGELSTKTESNSNQENRRSLNMEKKLTATDLISPTYV